MLVLSLDSGVENPEVFVFSLDNKVFHQDVLSLDSGVSHKRFRSFFLYIMKFSNKKLKSSCFLSIVELHTRKSSCFLSIMKLSTKKLKSVFVFSLNRRVSTPVFSR